SSEIEGHPGTPAKAADGNTPAQQARSPEPGLRQLRPKDYQGIWEHTRLFSLWDVQGDVDAVIPFITDNPLWNQRGVRLNGGTAVSTLRIRTVDGKGYAWFKHRSNRLNGFPKHVALLGRPGAGKGEHGVVLARELGVPHISAGDLVRKAVTTDEFPEIGAIVRSGGLVNDELMLEMLLKELKKPEYKAGYVLDGFPRNLKQLAMVKQYGIAVDAYVYFDIDAETYHQRIQTRREAALAAGLKPRSDDSAEAAQRRLREYETQTEPMVKEIQRDEPDKFIQVNTQTPKQIQFDDARQSIDYVYEYNVLPALQGWIHSKKPFYRNGRNSNNHNSFDHPTLSPLKLPAPPQRLPSGSAALFGSAA